MYQVIKAVSFCYGHRLPDYEGKCANIHGHNARVEIVLSGNSLDNRGILADFSGIQASAGGWINETLDHVLLLRRDDPLIPDLDRHGEKYFPMDKNPTAENIATLIYTCMSSSGFPVVSVRLWETESCYASFSPDPE